MFVGDRPLLKRQLSDMAVASVAHLVLVLAIEPLRSHKMGRQPFENSNFLLFPDPIFQLIIPGHTSVRLIPFSCLPVASFLNSPTFEFPLLEAPIDSIESTDSFYLSDR